ncbi:hypothetical protein PG985_008925 [Apiospora marii]|uniref:Small ribosomal subunit protein mS37 n=1 Tax=Apiospora marii TaxID=335849 RepID=A0ABR1RBA2_9PEZI
MSGVQKPMRLPPVRVLRVKNPNKQAERPCMQLMSSVLACWASSGYNTAGCAQMEQALRNCMDAPQPPPPRTNEINYHLSRFHSRVAGVKKK